MSTSVVYMTAGTRDEAIGIARTLIEERLLACANIIDGITSVYRWQGETHQDPEVVLIGKTKTSLVPAAMERAVQLHSYECPCVTSWQIDAIHGPYAEWLGAETRTPAIDGRA